MYSTFVLLVLFIFALCGVWLFLVGSKTHDKTIDRIDDFKNKNFEEEKGEMYDVEQ